jgi:hypothetical protein
MSRAKRTIATTLVAGIFFATGSAGQAQAPNDTSKLFQDTPALFASVSGLATWRSRPDNGIIVGNNPFTGVSFSTGRDFDFGRSTNVDATVGFRFWRTEAIEVRFLNFDSNASHSFRTPGAFIGAGFTGPANTLFDGTAATKMESWEINWRHQLFDQLTVLAGYRQIHVTDSAHYAINSTVAFGEYDYVNKLRGVQIGAEWAILPITSPIQVNLVGKIGRYSLDTSGGISEFQGAGHTFIGGFFGSASDHVYGSEAAIFVGYRVSNTVMLRAGYDALWLRDLGLATNNASASLLNPSLLRGNPFRDTLLLQSVSVGLAIGY